MLLLVGVYWVNIAFLCMIIHTDIASGSSHLAALLLNKRRISKKLR